MRNHNRKLNMEMISVILALAWPTMLEQLLLTAVQYIDTAMVGSLGTRLQQRLAPLLLLTGWSAVPFQL